MTDFSSSDCMDNSASDELEYLADRTTSDDVMGTLARLGIKDIAGTSQQEVEPKHSLV